MFRDDEGDPVLTVSTELQPNPERAALYVETHTSDLAIALTGDNVEELHEWTSYVLAGRARTLQLCGFERGPYVCVLDEHHSPPHVTRDGIHVQPDVGGPVFT